MPLTGWLRPATAALLLVVADASSLEAHGLTRLHAPLASMLAANVPQPDLKLEGAWWPPEPSRERPRVLAPLYISFVALQVMDADSTADAIRAGHGEANPFMTRAAHHTGTMVAVKAISTAGTIYAVEKLWRRNRVAAVVVMAAINTGYAAVVTNNYARARGR